MPLNNTRASASTSGFKSAGGGASWVINTTYTFYGYTAGNQNVGYQSGLSSSVLSTNTSTNASALILDWTFSVPAAGIIQFKIQDAGVYRIECAGGRGGSNSTGGAAGTLSGGGYGAVITSNISLNKGEFVNILCGSRGGDYTGSQCGGGGGGSFVSTGATFSTSTIIIAAGGGGGGGNGGGVLSSMHGQTGTSGAGWGGGTSGNGGTQGSGSEAGASGGGWLSNGTGDGQCRGYGVRPNNGIGINGPYGSNFGGFGGGAAGWGAGGGGGGYSGGGAMSDSSNVSNRNSAGGAGSYYTGTIQATAQNHTLNGYVTMQRIS